MSDPNLAMLKPFVRASMCARNEAHPCFSKLLSNTCLRCSCFLLNMRRYALAQKLRNPCITAAKIKYLNKVEFDSL